MDKFNAADVVLNEVLTPMNGISPFPFLHTFLNAFTVEEEAEIREEAWGLGLVVIDA